MRELRALALVILCFVATGRAVKVVDGDMFDAELQVWSNVAVRERVRVLGVNTPEMKGATKDAAAAAAMFTQEWLRRGEFMLRTCGRDSFGRVLGIVTRNNDGGLAEALIEAKHGSAYRDGRSQP